MTFRDCEPVALPDCELDDLAFGALVLDECDTKPYEIGAAMARAGTAIIESHGLMDVADTFVTIGSPGAWPDCCNVIGVGVVQYETQTDGSCWTKVDPVYELLFSACKPGYDDRTERVPTGGPLDGCDPDTLNGHALAFTKTLAALTRNLSEAICCFLPDFDCECCLHWRIDSVTVENSEACTEARITLIRS